MDRPSSKAGHRRQPLQTRDTSIHVPQTTQKTSSEQFDATGEPLIEDFQTQQIPLPHIPRSPDSPTYPGLGLQHEFPSSPNFLDDTDDSALPPPDLHPKRGKLVDVPPRASSNTKGVRKNLTAPGQSVAGSSVPTTPESRDRSSVDSTFSEYSAATSYQTLPPLQTKGPQDDYDRLEPVLEDDPTNFDLVAAPQEQATGIYQMEQRSEQLYSSAHLELIFADPKILLKFTTYLNAYRPQSIRMLVFYLDALKALRAIRYANAIADSLVPLHSHQFTLDAARETTNTSLEAKANEAFEVLVRHDLPAYIAYSWTQVVSTSIQRRITGTLAPHLREASEGLAEVFCLSDPSRPDNPIVFASEEFARTTQYGMGYSIGRNCRFLQGPRTNPHSVQRLAEACRAGKEHTEVFINYRRDGSPFMNLLMIAPLIDSRGTIRYFIGAQVDVSGLLKDCTGLPALEQLVIRTNDPEFAATEDRNNAKDEFQELAEMFNSTEMETVRKSGGHMHKETVDEEEDRNSSASHRPRLLLNDPSGEDLKRSSKGSIEDIANGPRLNGKLQGVYQHYLLLRPAPSLRILFTSPSLRVPGILQSPFLSRIGGSSRVRTDLAQALSEGRGVTAKIRWLARPDDDGEGDGRSRWIHCTPLLGHSGSVGVWMVVLIDEEGGVIAGEARRRFRPAPPVSTSIGGKEYDAEAAQLARDRTVALQAKSHADLRVVASPAPQSPITSSGTAAAARPHASRRASRDESTMGQTQNRAKMFHVAQQDRTLTRDRDRDRERSQTAMADYGAASSSGGKRSRPQSQQSFVLK